MRNLINALVVAALPLALVACTADEGGTEPDPRATSESAAPAGPSSAVPSEPAGAVPTATDDEPSPPVGTPDFGVEPQRNAEFPAPSLAGEDLYAAGVRVAAHQGYDRLVIDFAGSGTPAWAVEYVDAATVPEGEEVIDVGGEHTLRITMQDVSSPENHGQDDLSGPLPVGDAQLVRDVFSTGSFETVKTVYVGVDEEVPFRTFTLTDPSRLVVDVAVPQ